MKIDSIPEIPGSEESAKYMEEFLKDSTPIQLGGIFFGQVVQENEKPFTMHFIFQDDTGKKFDCCVTKVFLTYLAEHVTRARGNGWGES